MNLADIIQSLELKAVSGVKDFGTIIPTGGYSADLLSCVMTGAPRGGIWVTLQAHANVVAVAALLELSAVIITEDAQPEPSIIQKANQEGITLLTTPKYTYEVVGKLWEMGLRVAS